MALWNRVFAAAYDPFLAAAERKGIAAARARLLRGVCGAVLEIGAGTGLNLAHYPDGVDLVLTEPDEHMARRLESRVPGTEVLRASAEDLPFPDDTFDAVVSTLVLCTVPDVPAALREIRRVLRPGGRLLFLEHVKAEPGSGLEQWQNRLERPWHAFACGCHCNRDLVGAFDAASFELADLTHERWAFMPAIVRPVVTGAALPG